ncbi:MAG TPA: alpha/beta fold hydrolase [Nevskiaceae bacterium]|nr:alpha/beta fold hydrolase [Nevskiaceae bacterium]
MRDDVLIDSHGERLATWYYRAPAGPAAPCVVMAHGFSATREQRLDAYADRFQQAGFAVLLFDYRGFGASSGEPRQWLDIERQHQDYRAVLAWARARPELDASRLALFGSSFSGGHVQALAAEDSGIAAAIAQVPFADGLLNLPHLGLSTVLRLTAAGLRDELQQRLSGQPYRVAAAGAPGSLAIMTTPQSAPGFARLAVAGGSWRNEVCARIALRVGLYRPGLAAGRIRCPILYAIADQDDLTPPGLALAAARRAPRAEIRHYACGHFDPYLPPLFDTVVSDQIDFLRRHLAG